jgi:hypothetical protein
MKSAVKHLSIQCAMPDCAATLDIQDARGDWYDSKLRLMVTTPDGWQWRKRMGIMHLLCPECCAKLEHLQQAHDALDQAFWRGSR